MQNGKGSQRRLSLVSQDVWDKNYNEIFRKKKKNGKRNKSTKK